MMAVKHVYGAGAFNNDTKQGKYGATKIDRGSVRRALCQQSFEEAMQRAKDTLQQVETPTPRADAKSDVLNELYELNKLGLAERIEALNRSYTNSDLETALNVPSDYYRNRYYALLEIVSLTFNVDGKNAD